MPPACSICSQFLGEEHGRSVTFIEDWSDFENTDVVTGVCMVCTEALQWLGIAIEGLKESPLDVVSELGNIKTALKGVSIAVQELIEKMEEQA